MNTRKILIGTGVAAADRLVEVLGPTRGIGARATIGVQSLAGNHCYESWIEVEIR